MMIDTIYSDSTRIAIIISSQFLSESKSSQFITHDSDALQLGTIIRKAGDKIEPHSHHKLDIQYKGQKQEFIYVISGSVTVNFYDKDNKLITERVLLAGDSMLQLAGGHSFNFNEDTQLLEVKQGPYISKEKDKRPI